MTKSYPAPYFVGQNVIDARDAIIASVVSNTHVLLIGEQGCGKTAIGKWMMRHMVNDKNKYVFIALNPSTPAERIGGVPDVSAIIQRSEYVTNPKGSAFDPDALMVMLDEFGRLNNPGYDLVLNATQRDDLDNLEDGPCFIMTANTMPTSERFAAVEDRISVYYRYPDEVIDTYELVEATTDGLHSEINARGEIPEWSDIEVIRAMRFPQESRLAVGDFIDELRSECIKGIDVGGNKVIFKPTKRRMTQWTRLLERTSAYYYGSATFSQVHKKAAQAIAYAWPCLTPADSENWRSLVGGLVDTIGSAVQAAFDKAYLTMKELHDNKANYSDRMALITAAGSVMASQQANLQALGNDERVADAIGQLSAIYAKIVRGEDPFTVKDNKK